MLIKYGLLMMFTLCSISLAGCCTTEQHNGTRVHDPETRDSLLKLLSHTFPKHFNAVHRGVIQAGSQEWAITGYVESDRELKLRYVAIGDLGATLFAVEQNRDQAPTILRSLNGVPEALILQGAIRHAQMQYLWLAPVDVRLYRTPDAQWALTMRSKSNAKAIHTFVFDPETQRLRSARVSRNGCLLFSLQYNRYRQFDGWPTAVPTHVVLDDVKLQCHLDFNVVQLTVDQENGANKEACDCLTK